MIAEVDPEAVLRVGSRPYVYRDDLDALRQAHRETHFFRRDRDTIASVAVVPGHDPIGEIRERRVRELGSYMPALVLDALLRYFVGAQRPVLRHRPLTVLTARREDRLLRQALPDGVRLPGWIEQRIQYVFDTRPVYGDGRPPAVLLVCDARTAITIDATGAALLAAGVPLDGLYVQTVTGDVGDPRLRPKARLAGRVVRVDGDQLVLDDHGTGPGVVAADSVVLEPRRENVAHCLRHLVPQHADAIRGRLERLTAAVASGPERLRRIQAMFDHLRTIPLDVVPGMPVRLSEVVRHGQDGVWSPLQGVLPRPPLIFDPGGQRTDSWSERGLDKFGPFDRGSMPVKRPRIAVVCEAGARTEVDRFMQRLVDGMPDLEISGRQPYSKGLVARYALETPVVKYFEAVDGGAPAYQRACRAAIQHAADCGAEWHVALVQIDDASRQLAGADDPYLIAKSAFMKRQVPVQEVTLQNATLPPRDLAFILSNISLALYAKLGGTPWLLPAKSAAAHEIVLGLGSYEAARSRLGARERVVGVTTAFTADGRYLLESRTRAVPYEDYASAMLGALRDAVTTVGREHNWRRSDPVRLVVHAFKPIKDVEVDAVERLITDLGLPNATFAFLHVAGDHPFLLFDEAQPGRSYQGTARGAFAPGRGTVVPLGRDEWLLSLTGPKELKQASDGMPSPTLLKLHRKSTYRNMKYLARQAYAFACHSWRGFGLSAQPVTILYSDQIARVLKNSTACRTGMRTRWRGGSGGRGGSCDADARLVTVPERTREPAPDRPAPPASAPLPGSVLLDVVVRTLDVLSTRAVAQHPVVAAYAVWLAAPCPPAAGVSDGDDGSRHGAAALRDALRRTGATRRYHDVAVLGYAAGTAGADARTAAAFRDGLAWLRGRRYFSANQPLGLEADGLALLGIAAGIAAVSDPSERDADARWLADLADESVRRTTAPDPWEHGLRCAARLVACGPGLAHCVAPPRSVGADGDLEPDLATALAAKRLLAPDATQELAAMRTVLTPDIVDVAPARTVTQRAALRWLLRQGATALPRRASVTDVVEMLAAVPHALKRWPWEDRPKTSRAGAFPQRWDVQNEYHVQSLLWSMLAPVFPDIEDEEYLAVDRPQTSACGPRNSLTRAHHRSEVPPRRHAERVVRGHGAGLGRHRALSFHSVRVHADRGVRMGRLAEQPPAHRARCRASSAARGG